MAVMESSRIPPTAAGSHYKTHKTAADLRFVVPVSSLIPSFVRHAAIACSTEQVWLGAGKPPSGGGYVDGPRLARSRLSQRAVRALRWRPCRRRSHGRIAVRRARHPRGSGRAILVTSRSHRPYAARPRRDCRWLSPHRLAGQSVVADRRQLASRPALLRAANDSAAVRRSKHRRVRASRRTRALQGRA